MTKQGTSARGQIKRNEIDILELKVTIAGKKKSLQAFSRRFEQKKESANVNIGLQFEEQKAKRVKKNEQCLRDLQNSIKLSNVLLGIVKEERKKRAERLSEEKLSENLPNFVKDVIVHLQEAQKTLSRIDSKRSTSNT